MKKKILVVDDMAYIRISAERFLKETNLYEVETAADGIEAIKKFGSFKPDLIVLDIFLPKIDGLQLVRLFKSASFNTKILICSVTSDEKIYEEAIASGADGWMKKPLKKDVFLKKIEELFAIETKEKPQKIATGRHEVSEKISIKLDISKNLQMLYLYGKFTQNDLKDLKETINGLQLYHYFNVIVNLNGITDLEVPPEEFINLQEEYSKKGKLLFVISPKNMREKFISAGVQNIYPAEIIALKEIK